MTEIESGGWNEGPELRLLVQSNQIMDLPRVIAGFTDTQREIFAQYRRQPSDFEPFFGRRDGYRFNDEWTFPRLEA